MMRDKNLWPMVGLGFELVGFVIGGFWLGQLWGGGEPLWKVLGILCGFLVWIVHAVVLVKRS